MVWQGGIYTAVIWVYLRLFPVLKEIDPRLVNICNGNGSHKVVGASPGQVT